MKRNSHELYRPDKGTILGITLILIGCTLLFAAPVTAQQPPGELNVSNETIEASPGTSLTVNATIENAGDRQIGPIDAWMTDAPNGWNTSNTSVQRLPANASETVQFNVSIPGNASVGEYSMAIRAESRENISAQGVVTVEIPGDEPTATETTNGSSGGAPPMGPVGGGGGSSCTSIWIIDFCLPDFSSIIDGFLEGLTDKIPLI